MSPRIKFSDGPSKKPHSYRDCRETLGVWFIEPAASLKNIPGNYPAITHTIHIFLSP